MKLTIKVLTVLIGKTKNHHEDKIMKCFQEIALAHLWCNYNKAKQHLITLTFGASFWPL